MGSRQVKSEFNLGNALHLRMRAAVEAAGGREAVLTPIVESVFELVKDADVARMRELGGYSAVIATVLGQAVDEMRNELQIPTSAAYWLWRFRTNNTDWIREQVQIKRSQQQ